MAQAVLRILRGSSSSLIYISLVGDVTVSGDSFGFPFWWCWWVVCVNQLVSLWVETRDPAKHPPMHITASPQPRITKKVPCVISTEINSVLGKAQIQNSEFFSWKVFEWRPESYSWYSLPFHIKSVIVFWAIYLLNMSWISTLFHPWLKFHHYYSGLLTSLSIFLVLLSQIYSAHCKQNTVTKRYGFQFLSLRQHY